MNAEIIGFQQAVNEMLDKDFKNSKYIYWFYNEKDYKWTCNFNEIKLSNMVRHSNDFIIVKLPKKTVNNVTVGNIL
jgi:hypothetical protein